MVDIENLDMSKTYIYDGEEYLLTGRIAQRTEQHISSRPRRSTRNVSNQEADVVVEITPAPTKVKVRGPTLITQDSKWVKYSDLYEVSDKMYEDAMEESYLNSLNNNNEDE